MPLVATVSALALIGWALGGSFAQCGISPRRTGPTDRPPPLVQADDGYVLGGAYVEPGPLGELLESPLGDGVQPGAGQVDPAEGVPAAHGRIVGGRVPPGPVRYRVRELEPCA